MFLYAGSSFATGLPSAISAEAISPLKAALFFLVIMVCLIAYGIYYGIFIEGKDKDKNKTEDNDE